MHQHAVRVQCLQYSLFDALASVVRDEKTIYGPGRFDDGC